MVQHVNPGDKSNKAPGKLSTAPRKSPTASSRRLGPLHSVLGFHTPGSCNGYSGNLHFHFGSGLVLDRNLGPVIRGNLLHVQREPLVLRIGFRVFGLRLSDYFTVECRNLLHCVAC